MPNFEKAGDEFGINTTFARSQAQAEITRLTNSSLVAVWVDADFNTTAGRNLRAQIYNADGIATGAELTLRTLNGLINPNVAGLANGNFVVTWQGFGTLVAQIFDTSGVALGAQFSIATGGGSSIGRPDIVALASGGFAVAWHDTRTTGADVSRSGVHVRSFTETGAPVGADILVNTATAGNQLDPSISALANGGYVVTWTDNGAPGSGASWLAKAQIFDAAGVRIGGEIIVTGATTGVSAVETSVTTLANGNFAVAWYGTDDHEIQVFTAGGVPVGSRIIVPNDLAGTQVGPSIAALDDGGFAIAWTADIPAHSDGSDRGVFVRVFDAAGQQSGTDMQANSQANGSQFDPSIVALAGGGFVVTWTDLNGAGADDDEVRAQRFMPHQPLAITSMGGGASASVSVSENNAEVGQVTASGSSVTYSISGGADAALFAIDSATGALSFIAAPDFETGGDNLYDVIVSASDGINADTQAISITVGNVNEAVTVTSGTAFTLAENATTVTTVTASDIDGDTVFFSIAGGADAALFAIDAATGALTFVAAPNFEAPGDVGGENVYDVTVAASDGTFTDTRALSVTVGNANEAIAITSGSAFVVAENGTQVSTVTANDLDSDVPGYSIIGGADAALFTIDAVTGELRFAAAPDFEAPADAGGDNVYDVMVSASDGVFVDTRAVAVSVINTDEGVAITSSGGGAIADVSVFENVTSVAVVSASDIDGDAVTYSVDGGADAARFVIDTLTGVLSFATAPDFEVPGDSDGDNRYDLVVRASSGAFSDTQALSVSVGNVNEGVAITSSGGGNAAALSIVENATAIATVLAVDADGGAVTYAIAGGSDAARFAIDANTGALRFIAAPNHEAPADAGGNNVYDVIVSATDGVFSDTQALAVTVTDAREGNAITGNNSANTISATASPTGQLRATDLEDTIYGLGGNDNIQAAGGEDIVDGGAGNDTINGGAGADVLTGGTGADRFVFSLTTDSGVSAADLVTDFSHSQGDRIDLNPIDARTTQSGNQAFTFIGTSAFSGAAGQLRFEQINGNTFVTGDVNGDGVADFGIQIGGLVSLVATDFVL